MKIEFEKKIWFQAKAKLLRLYQILSETDFIFSEGGERRMMERIRTKIHLSRNEFYSLVGLISNDSTTENIAYSNISNEVEA